MKKLIALKYLLVLLLFTGMGCEETVIDQEFVIGQESAFHLNQLYTSADGQYTLLIQEISDSRCPEGVQCIWQGEVTIKGEWSVNGSKSAFEVHSVVSQQDKLPAGISLKIVDAKPYPKYGTESKPEDLVVTLLVKKL
jgi:hypothetical protein